MRADEDMVADRCSREGVFRGMRLSLWLLFDQVGDPDETRSHLGNFPIAKGAFSW
jgi:hypothetical protein